jgi:predicted nucleic acid-binding protein
VRLLLDTGVLGYVCHPNKHLDVRAWLQSLLRATPRVHDVLISEVADYELRRELIRIKSNASLRNLDLLAADATYLPLDTPTMRAAAAEWARLRGAGLATAGDDSLDADVILAAQAVRYGATVVTDNPKHLGRMVPVLAWRDVP